MKVTAIFHLKNLVEITNMRTGQIFYFKPEKLLNIMRFKMGQTITWGDLK